MVQPRIPGAGAHTTTVDWTCNQPPKSA